MTPLSTFALELRQSLDEAAWPWTLAALRQDSLVWDSLENGPLGRRALDRGPLAPEHWSPGALALLELEQTGLAENLKTTPLLPLPQPLAAQAARSFEDWLKRGAPAPASLSQAGLLALAVREQRRQKASWASLSAEIVARGPAVRSVLAVLAGLSPDPFDLLRAILRPGDPAYQPDLALHALLSNPFSPQAQAEIISALLDELPLSQRLGTLRLLSAQRPSLAAYQAQRLLGGANGRRLLPRLAPLAAAQPQDGWNEPAGIGALNEQLAQAAALSQHVEAHRAAGQHSQAVPLLSEALQTARRLEARLAAQLALAAEQSDDERLALDAWKQAAQLAPASPYFASGLAQALLRAGRPDDAQAYLETRQDENTSAEPHPALLLAAARLAAQRGETDQAGQAARQVLDALLARREGESALHPDPEDFFSPLARLLLDLGLAGEAVQAAGHELERKPNDARGLALLAQAQFCLGQPQAALSNVYAALAAEKLSGEQAAGGEDGLALRRLLVDILEAAGEWSAALSERSLLLQRQAEPALAELHALAHCALQAGQPQQALPVCRKALESDPNDGLAYLLLGQAAQALGDEPTALEHLHRATELAPEHAGAWIALAQLHQNAGDPEQGLAVLRAASQAAPNSAEVHLALGEACLASGSPTQALTALRQAAALVQPSAHNSGPAETCPAAGLTNQALTERRQAAVRQQRIALRFGQTLYQLGHLEEARQVLCDAYQSASQAQPVDPEVSYAYAKALLALHDLPPALAPLQVVVESSPAEPAPYLEYAQVLLQVVYPPESGARQALPYLQRLLDETGPGRPVTPLQRSEARALLAEALAATGQLEQSIASFRQALDSPLVNQPGWRARLSLGLGRTALALGQIETAVAALQETAQSDPSNPAVQRSLCEAYLAAGLREEAVQAAQAALALNPSDLESLVWYADLAPRLQAQPAGAAGQAQLESINLQAIQALSRAAQIAPYRADLVLRLGQMQLHNGDRQAARQTFTRLVEAAQNLRLSATALPGQPAPAAGMAPADLYQAAIRLGELGEAPGAVILLERAITLRAEQPPETAGPAVPSMLAELAQAHWQAGNSPAALEALDQAIQLQPGDAGLFIQKSDLLLKMQRPQSALACLESALAQSLQDRRLHLRAAAILRSNGELHAALAHAERAVNSAPAESGVHLPAQYEAAVLALAMLQEERAAGLLGDLGVARAAEIVRRAEAVEAGQPEEPGQALPYFCLYGELALHQDDEPAAGQALAAAQAIDPQQPRVLALQARLAARRGDLPAAAQALDTAMAALNPAGEPGDPLPTALLRPLAEAALELARWPQALDLLGQAARQAAQEPLSHLLLARALTLRAEAQRLCQAAEVTGHAPGPDALQEPAFQAFQSAIQSAGDELDRLAIERKRPTGSLSPAGLLNAARHFETPQSRRPGDLTGYPAQLIHWRGRGLAAFQPTLEHVQAFQALLEGQTVRADVLAALMAALNQAGERAAAVKAAQLHPQHPAVLRQLALVVAETNPRQALGLARTALEILSRQPSLHSAEAPLLHALQARLALQAEPRPGESLNAQQSIQAALAAWPDEPRWHALAAEISLGSGAQSGGAQSPEAGAPDLAAAIAHLQEAVRLEPGYAPHSLALGQVYLEDGDQPHAIQVLEQATQAAPDQGAGWLALAKAQRLAGDLNQAANSAERAIERSADPIEPLLLRGDLALQTNNPRGAQSRAQAVLRLAPDHPAGLHLQARALAALGRPEEALACLEKAISLARQPLPMQLERANLLRRTQGPDKALKALHSLAESYPEDPAVLSTLAEALLEYGQNEAALQAARLALQADSNQLSQEEQANLHFLVGRQLRRSGQLDQAVHHLSEAIRHNPNALEAALELGRAHQDRRQPTQALAVYQQMIKAAPGDPRAYYQAGTVLKENKDYLGAESMLRKAAELAPSDVSIHRLLGAVVALNLVHNRRQPA